MFILDLSICTLSTILCKFSVGSLRPYFLSICNPNLEKNCFGEDSYYMDKNSNQIYYWDINNNQTKNILS